MYDQLNIWSRLLQGNLATMCGQMMGTGQSPVVHGPDGTVGASGKAV